jgi:hypothetical protein
MPPMARKNVARQLSLYHASLPQALSVLFAHCPLTCREIPAAVRALADRKCNRRLQPMHALPQ